MNPETIQLNLGLSLSAEQVADIQWWILILFFSAFPAMIVGQLARARAEIKGPILGRVSRELDRKIPL